MSHATLDDLSYRVLRSLVYGEGVSVNINCLSRSFGKHRNTIRAIVRSILENRLLNPPIFPYTGLQKEYPLLALTWILLPYEEEVEEWFKEDPHIFAAFRSRYSDYNTLIITYHKDIPSYQSWQERLVVKRKIRLLDGFMPQSSVSFFSNQFIIKYDPSAPICLLEEELDKTGQITLGRCKLDKLSFQIIKLLAKGECVKINEKKLSDQLGVNRKTITKRVRELIKNEWISTPVCRFPDFFTPPNYILAICKLEIRSYKQDFFQNIMRDPHITLAFDIKEGRYNILLFGAFKNLEEELEWEIKQGLFFPNSIGQVDIQYFSSKHIIDISQTYVSLGIIDEKYVHFRT